MTDIELREILAHIDAMRIDTEHKIEDIRRVIAEHDKIRQEHKWYPLVVSISAMTAGGALVTAAFTLAKVFGV